VSDPSPHVADDEGGRSWLSRPLQVIEIAAIYDVDRSTARRWLVGGAIRGQKIGSMWMIDIRGLPHGAKLPPGRRRRVRHGGAKRAKRN
jgi:hypothetical protein